MAMKPLFSILVMSHNRLPLLLQALDTAQAQNYPNLEILIVDSGSLVDKIPPGRIAPFTKIIASGESPDLHKTTAMPSWIQNKFIGQLNGEWITCLSDDDLLLPTYISAFADRVSEGDAPAFLYTGQFRVRANQDGAIYEMLHIQPADKTRGPGEFDCKIDYLQCAVNRAMWNTLYQQYHNMPYPEELESSNHADGVFMERASLITPAIPVQGFHCFNRRTPSSRYCGA